MVSWYREIRVFVLYNAWGLPVLVRKELVEPKPNCLHRGTVNAQGQQNFSWRWRQTGQPIFFIDHVGDLHYMSTTLSTHHVMYSMRPVKHWSESHQTCQVGRPEGEAFLPHLHHHSKAYHGTHTGQQEVSTSHDSSIFAVFQIKYHGRLLLYGGS